jgi:hypothetical protein
MRCPSSEHRDICLIHLCERLKWAGRQAVVLRCTTQWGGNSYRARVVLLALRRGKTGLRSGGQRELKVLRSAWNLKTFGTPFDTQRLFMKSHISRDFRDRFSIYLCLWKILGDGVTL